MEAPVATGGALALSPAAVGGRRHKLKLVTRKVARKALKKLGLKMRGGEDAAAPVAVTPEMAKAGGADPSAAPSVAAPAMGGKRKKTKKGKRSASRRASNIFGL